MDMIGAVEAAVDRIIVEKYGEVFSFAHDILKQSCYELMFQEEQLIGKAGTEQIYCH
jgi:hypothetical protein